MILFITSKVLLCLCRGCLSGLVQPETANYVFPFTNPKRSGAAAWLRSRMEQASRAGAVFNRLAQGVHGDAQEAGDHLHPAAGTGSELLEASWHGPRLELRTATDTAAACSRFPSNPKLKRSFFFCPRRVFYVDMRRVIQGDAGLGADPEDVIFPFGWP